MQGSLDRAFCLTRPPGHHATKDRGMGFCILNHIAIAARHLQAAHSFKKILIIDFDVHHGNGTQDIFYQDPDVFYFSVHQGGIYPGSGKPTERGEGKGEGTTLNVQLQKGESHLGALQAIRNQLRPAMEKFKPEFILVSAGFDAHENDPLGGLAYTDKGYGAITREIRSLAHDYSKNRLLFILEGGYGLPGLSTSVVEVLKALLEP